MKTRPRTACTILLAVFLLVAAAAVCQAQSAAAAPPVAQPLIREGDFAIKLQSALGLGASEEETEAETRLAQAGVAPGNGWIADYPVTPDILGEIEASLAEAADAGKLPVGRGAALAKLAEVSGAAGLAIRAQDAVTSYDREPPGVEDYPNPAVINNYFYDEGPPVVTYYAPPPDYYYLYSWVPSPFWFGAFWFGGYYILHDFHRHVHGDHRARFVSNHFNDLREHRVFRVDPVSRFNGRTYSGIGGRRGRHFLATGVPGSDRRVFNAPRLRAQPGMKPAPGMRPAPRRTVVPESGRALRGRPHTPHSVGPAAATRSGGALPRGMGGHAAGAAPGGATRPGASATPPALPGGMGGGGRGGARGGSGGGSRGGGGGLPHGGGRR